jgi:hypothetical protein
MSEKDFRLTRSEFAKSLDISTDLLKKRMKRGHYSDYFIKRENQYYFKPYQEGRPFIVNSLGKKVPRKRNRGNHLDSKNPRYTTAMRNKNHSRMLARLQGETDKEVLDNLPKALEIAKQQKQNRIRNEINNSIPKNYGGMVTRSNPRGSLTTFKTSWTSLEPKPKDEYDKYLEDNDLETSSKYKYYY